MLIDDTLEVKEVISSGEEKFEHFRNRIGLFIGPLAFLIIYFIPINGLNEQAHTLSAILAWTCIWWITEPIPIPVTALLASVFCILFHLTDAKKMFSSYADPIIFLFLGSFILANAMAYHGLDKRFAFKILSLKGIGDHSGRLLFAFGAITAIISMWISNTATTAMMFPIAVGIVAVYEKVVSELNDGKFKKTRFATGIMLMTAYAASAGGIGTPVGTPPNLIGIGMLENLAHIKISFFQWMAFAVPLLFFMYLFLFGLMYLLHKPEIKDLAGASSLIKHASLSLGKLTRGEINCLIAFFTAVSLWIIPGILSIIYTTNSQIYKSYNSIFPESVVALIAVFILFLLPVNWKQREFTITWRQAVKIDWGTLILFGGGIALGNLMFETKLADFFGKWLLSFSGVSSIWGITLIAIYLGIIVSEATSNTASANMVVPVIISICLAANMNPVPASVGATLGASWGFMLPVSTPPNSIVYGSGMVPITKMIRAGILFDIFGGLIIWLGIRILSPIVGFM